MDTVVISLGGSVLVPGDSDAEYIKTLSTVLKGGRIARYYINTGRALGLLEPQLDDLGIAATRMNANLLIAALGNRAYPRPALDVDQAHSAKEDYAIVVMGGTLPGHTTDAVSAMLAEKVGASRLVNATNVDGVYDSDPKKNPDAKKFDTMTYEQLQGLSSGEHDKAGPNVIFDPKGLGIISQKKIPLLVCNGRNLEALKDAIQGNDFEGTVVGQ
jgi:uridylate kinase